MDSSDTPRKKSFLAKHFYAMTLVALVVLVAGLVGKVGYDNLKNSDAIRSYNASGIAACEKAGGRVTYQDQARTMPVYDDTGNVACSKD